GRFAVMGHPRIRHLLVAGGAGFLGAAFVRDRLRADPEILITVLDALRRPAAAGDLADLVEDRRFRLVRGDVCDRSLVEDLAGKADAIVNFASEEFVGGTSADAPAFARTDVQGTANLLEAARKFRHQRFLLASSMEVYGPVKGAPNREDDAIDPRTLAAAARAAAGMLARAYQVTHGLPVLITRGVPSYGPRQPLDQPVAGMIAAALQGLPVAVDAAARLGAQDDAQRGATADGRLVQDERVLVARAAGGLSQMRARFPIWPVLAALALSACGSGGSPSSGSTPSSSSSVSAAGSQPLIVVAEQAAGGFDSGATTVHLMRRDGTEADRLTIKQHSMVSRAAGSRIFVTGNDGSLKAVHRDGSVESLGSVGTSQPAGFIVSPDGKRWMWQTNDGNTS